MSTWIKRLVFAFVALLIISLVGIAIFFLTFDPNAYRDKLEEYVYQRYERHLNIEGEIELSLFPRIGLSVQSVRLSETGSEEPFAAVRNMRFSVAVWPLLWNRLVVDHLSLEGVQAWFEVGPAAQEHYLTEPPEVDALAHKDADDEPFWSWLLAQAQAQARPQPLEEAVLPRLQRSEFQVDIAGLEMHDSTFYFFDTQRRWSAQLGELSITTGRMTLEQPFDISIKGRLQSAELATDLRVDGQGVVTLAPYSGRAIVHRSHFQFAGQAGDWQLEQGDLRGSAEYLYGQALDFEQFELTARGQDQTGALEDLSLSMRAQALGVNWMQQQLWWEGLLLRFEAEQSHRKINMALEAPKLWMTPDTTEAETIQGSARFAQGQEALGVQLSLADFKSGWKNLQARQFQLLGQYKNAHQSWRLQLESPLTWSFEDEQLEFDALHGLLRVDDEALADGFSARALEGSFFIQPWTGHAAGDLYGAPWTEVLPEEGESLTALVAPALETHNEYLSWLLWFDQENRPARLITNLQAEAFDLGQWLPHAQVRKQRKDTPAQRHQLSEPRIKTVSVLDQEPDLHWRALPINWFWQVDAGQFRVEQLWLESAQLNGHWVQDALEITEFKARLHDGTIQAHAFWQDSGQLHGYLQLDNIDTAALLAGLEVRPFLQGTGQLEATWHTQGTTAAAWLANLNMHAQADIREGAFIGFSVTQQIAAANEVLRQLFAADVPPMPEHYDDHATTRFEQAQFGLRGMKGQLVLDQLDVQDADYDLGLGHPAWVDLINQQLDIVLLLSLHSTGSEELPGYWHSFAQAGIPVRITGALQAPELRMQWADMPHRFVQEAIDEGLLDVLGMPVHASFVSDTKRERTVVEALVEDTAKYFGATLKEFLQKK